MSEKCMYFTGINGCLKNNDPDDYGDCVYKGGVEQKRRLLNAITIKQSNSKTWT